MYVVATAGHVDHGKSSLVRALTGTDPDRLAAEKERGLTIELGYAWAPLPGGDRLAFVDVPGHERFLPTMLAGVGPVPAVLLVVAADDPWMPQAAEHLAVLDLLGVDHGVVAVTRADLADPAPMAARVRAEVDRTSLAGAPVLPVSAVTGSGLDELREALARTVAALPVPDPGADVRLWVDRCFTVKGAGTVVTGTLPAGRVVVGDLLGVPGSAQRPLRVRGVRTLGDAVPAVTGVARVALNLAGEHRELLDRHSVLVTPDAWHDADVVDVRLRAPTGDPAGDPSGDPSGDTTGSDPAPPQRPLLHVGAVAVGAHLRPLAGDLVRLTLERPLPLRTGDRAVLRDPGSRRVWGVTVLDPAPPPLRRRGAADARAGALATADGFPDLAAELSRRGLVHAELLRRTGVPVGGLPSGALRTPDGWLLSAERAAGLRERLHALVGAERDTPPTTTVLADRLGLPSARVVEALAAPPLQVRAGRVQLEGRAVSEDLPEDVRRGVELVTAELEEHPFAAPTADRLAEVGLTARGVTRAAGAGRLLHVGGGVVLLPGADRHAAGLLAELPQPFTTSEARARLGTTRRVVLPLLQLLDKRGMTRRLPDDRRSVTGR
ncbi:MAG: Selenocysteine-specific translation elongation factor [uncultured Nocardioidaceae bacterium]|uniref:Selenocysteine-specific translation elongation factor n=1 Tax=uncultured Nocardioidaceae bacterium TaxID=253824 RepID=A0A6J4MRC6_9ACTN|nr:MAG: Selenocysteine-specific translation elongation factor [uncultured Nocardioidaceae bacterium]